MGTNVLTELCKELERVLPLVKALGETEVKLSAAQRSLEALTAAKDRAEQEAVSARHSTTASLAALREELDQKTAAFKAELVEKHRVASLDYDALLVKYKGARSREEEESRMRHEELRLVREHIASAKQELGALQATIATTKAEFRKALSGVGA